MASAPAERRRVWEQVEGWKVPSLVSVNLEIESEVDSVYDVPKDVEELYVQLDDEVVQVYDG